MKSKPTNVTEKAKCRQQQATNAMRFFQFNNTALCDITFVIDFKYEYKAVER
jgi:hypothetical protein